jgi:hypothetical protein
MTCREHAQGHQLGRAAMGPAAERPERSGAPAAAAIFRSPQWSRPIDGQMTAHHENDGL